MKNQSNFSFKTMDFGCWRVTTQDGGDHQDHHFYNAIPYCHCTYPKNLVYIIYVSINAYRIVNPKYVLNTWALSVEFFSQKKNQHCIFFDSPEKKTTGILSDTNPTAGQARHFGAACFAHLPGGQHDLDLHRHGDLTQTRKGKAIALTILYLYVYKNSFRVGT